jgi:catechol O-methyltransferase
LEAFKSRYTQDPIITNNTLQSHDGREQKLLEFIETHPSYSELKGSPSKILEAIDEFSAQTDFLINIGEDKGKIVADIIAQEKPRVFVELGGYIGYSAIFFADAMREAYPANEKLEYWSLEFESEFAAIASKLVDLAGLGDIVKVVVGSADASLKKLKEEGKVEKVDFLFLDHVEALYEQDLKVCESLELLPPGSTIVADNVVRPGAPAYRKYVRAHKGLDSRGVKGLIMPGGFEVSFAPNSS